MKIRLENEKDYKIVENLIKVAFLSAENSNGKEQNLVNKIRKSKKYIPELSMVAEKNGVILGHILLSEIEIKNKDFSFTSLALAPVSVLPEYQKQGVGSGLIKEAISKAQSLGYNSIVVLGYPTYYSKFGFKRAKDFDIRASFDNVDEYLMIMGLGDMNLKDVSGLVVYGKEFTS